MAGAGVASSGRQELPEAASSRTSVIVASHGKAYRFDDSAGVKGAPFLDGVYKSFGLSADSRHFLYLGANGEFPSFELYVHDLQTGIRRRVSGAAVHHAAWSPAGGVLAFQSMDGAGALHLSVFDLATGKETEVVQGRIEPGYLEWSEDGRELLYLTVEPLGADAFETQKWESTLHRYSLGRGVEETLRGVVWAQFSGGELVVAGKGVWPYRSIPNPGGAAVRRFVIDGERMYVNVLERGREVVKRWNPAAGAFEFVTDGRLQGRNSAGVLVSDFSAPEVVHKLLRQGRVEQLEAERAVRTASGGASALATPGTGWKLPYHGLAELVQGGQSYVDRSCDGASCLIVAHTATLGYALDFQQVSESNQGNQHVLAVESGTVAAVMNTVTCSRNAGCSSTVDTYTNPCTDPNSGAGNFVVVAHLDGSFSFYAHLRSGSVRVVPGQAVSQGTHLGDQGHTGSAATYNNYRGCGDHLHFQRQMSPVVWAQSIPTDFGEAPCLMNCTSVYQSANAELAPPPSLTSVQANGALPGTSVQITVNGTDFLYGTTLAVSGGGVAVSGVALASSTVLTATLTIDAGAAPGIRQLTAATVRGTSNALGFTVIQPVAIAPPGGSGAWYGAGGAWSHRRAVRIDRTKVSGGAPLLNFPLLFTVIDSQLRASARADGRDILFTAADGVTRLDHEIESYDASTGTLTAWVRIPALSPASDTWLYVYYGNPAAADQSNRAGVWDGSFRGVWHLNESVGTFVADSTANGNHGSRRAAGSPLAAAGRIGGAQSFNGNNDIITVPDSNSLDLTSTLTISAWIKASGWPNNYGNAIVNKEENYALRSGNVAAHHFDLLWWNEAGWIRNVRTTPPTTGAWHHVVGQASANDAYCIYVDGVLVSSAPANWYTVGRNLGGALTIGASIWDPAFLGLIDEVRVSSAVLTPDWIVTEFRNQGAPGTFYVLGAQEASGSAPPPPPPPAQVATPQIAPASGSYTSAQAVSITTATAGASIRYSTDGSTPTSTTGIVYTGPFTVVSSTTVRAIGYKAGMADSAVALAAFTITSTPPPTGGAPWYAVGGSWAYRKRITVDRTKVSGSTTLVNFPLLVSITDAQLRSGARTDGGDILFTAGDGVTKLSHEVESYDAGSGALAAWVRLPALSSAADTTIYVYYGNPTAANQSSGAGVWDASFRGVWHLNESVGTFVADSTANGNHGSRRAAGSPLAAAGRIGGAQSFNGNNDIITVPDSNSLDLTSTLTISAWIKASGWPNNYGNAIVNKEENYALRSGNVAAHHFDLLWWNEAGWIRNVRTTPPTTGAWHHVVGQASANDAYRIYVDGVLVSSAPANWYGVGRQLTGDLTIGASIWDPAFLGLIDEVRVSSAVLTSDWIVTEFRNQGAPGTFYVLGGQETSGGGAPPPQVAMPQIAPASGSYTSAQAVSITTATAGASIRYSTDGSTPTSTTGIVYTGPFTVVSSTTVRAIGYKAGMADSALAAASYTIPTAPPVGGTPWYSAGGRWSHRKPVRIDRTKVSGSAALANFPLLFTVTDQQMRASARADGRDILFTAGDGVTRLDHEIEAWDASSGTLTAWVRIPTLSPAADTPLFVYYGNPASADQSNRAGVWDGSFRGVWHMSESGATAAPDSTAYGNHGVKRIAGSPSAAAGRIGGAQSFNGNNDIITVPDSNSLDLTSTLTISAWIKASGWPNNYGNAIVNKEENYALRSGNVAAQHFDLLWWNEAGWIRNVRTTPPSTGAWHHVVGQASANDAYRIYVDGVLVSSAPANWYGVGRQLTGDLTIGASIWDPAFLGLIDEVRVSSAVLTPDWITTEFRNQGSPGTFYTVGTEQ